MNFTKRVKKLREMARKQNLDAVLISSVSDIIYLTGYSGFSIEEREAYLLITNGSHFLLTDARYSEAVKTTLPNVTLCEISIEIPLKERLKEVIKKEHSQTLGFEGHNLTFFEYEKLSECIKKLSPIDLSHFRIEKDVDEISKIKRACEIGDKAFEHILKQIKAGITEKELAYELEFIVKKQGADISFDPIIAFGANSAIPHHQTCDQKLKPNNIVLLDFGVKVDNYCSDMTRTVFFGKIDVKFKKIYATVLKSQQEAIKYIKQIQPLSKSNLNAKDLDKVARDYIIKQGFPSIPHSLGHGIGLEVHESPRLSPNSKDLLKSGMVFSIEPGIYISGWGGVRIEDLVVIQNEKLEILTKSPKELIEI